MKVEIKGHGILRARWDDCQIQTLVALQGRNLRVGWRFIAVLYLAILHG